MIVAYVEDFFLSYLEFLSYNSDILGTHLINQFDIISTNIISGFQNRFYLFYFGCHSSHMAVYLMADFSKNYDF